MELSKRLQAVADLITPQLTTVADIGTDHGYLPIWLLNSGKCRKAIAMDVKTGPLRHAEESRDKFLEKGELELRLSDGLKELKPGEADCAVLAGMGGSLMIRILSEGQAYKVIDSFRECILQPQSEIEKVRRFLEQKGYETIAENMVEENGKYYPMMKAVPHLEKKEINFRTEAELRYGKMLIESRHPVLKSYLLKEQRIRQQILAKLQRENGENASQRQRIRQLTEELQLIGQVLETYDTPHPGPGQQEDEERKERRSPNAL